MTLEAQRIAIAKLLGAQIIKKQFPSGWDGRVVIGKKWAWHGDEAKPCAYPGGGLHGFGWNDEAYPSELPNYPESLDACAEFEAGLSDEEYIHFCVHLNEIWSRDKVTDMPKITISRAASATAPQRCEAFLRLKGKWPQTTVPETKTETQEP